jgi:hypothetical protein
MNWNTSPELMERIKNSIRRIETNLPLRQVLAADLPHDCTNLPITGGWGYTREEAIVSRIRFSYQAASWSKPRRVRRRDDYSGDLTSSGPLQKAVYS